MIDKNIILDQQQPPLYLHEYIYKNPSKLSHNSDFLIDSNGKSYATGYSLTINDLKKIFNFLMNSVDSNDNNVKRFNNSDFPNMPDEAFYYKAINAEQMTMGSIWNNINENDFCLSNITDASIFANKLYNKSTWPSNNDNLPIDNSNVNVQKRFYYLNYLNWCLHRGLDSNGKYESLYKYRLRINENRQDISLTLNGTFNVNVEDIQYLQFKIYKHDINAPVWDTGKISLKNNQQIDIGANQLIFTSLQNEYLLKINQIYKIIVFVYYQNGTINQTNYGLIKCLSKSIKPIIKISSDNKKYTINSVDTPANYTKITKKLKNNETPSFGWTSLDSTSPTIAQKSYLPINLNNLNKKQIFYQAPKLNYGTPIIPTRKNCSYAKTSDTEIVNGKTYYIANNNNNQITYEAVQQSELKHSELSKYYEILKRYKKTSDTGVVSGKIYYTKNNNNYSQVSSPNIVDLPTYYELIPNINSDIGYIEKLYTNKMEKNQNCWLLDFVHMTQTDRAIQGFYVNDIYPSYFQNELRSKTLVIPRSVFDSNLIRSEWDNYWAKKRFIVQLPNHYCYERPGEKTVVNWVAASGLRMFYNEANSLTGDNANTTRFKQQDTGNLWDKNTMLINDSSGQFLHSILYSDTANNLAYSADRASFYYHNHLYKISNGQISHLTPAYIYNKTVVGNAMKSKLEVGDLCYCTPESQSFVRLIINIDNDGKYTVRSLQTPANEQGTAIGNNFTSDKISPLTGSNFGGITINNYAYLPHVPSNRTSLFNSSFVNWTTTITEIKNNVTYNTIELDLEPTDDYLAICFYINNSYSYTPGGDRFLSAKEQAKVLNDVIANIRIISTEDNILDANFFQIPNNPIDYYEYNENTTVTSNTNEITIDAIMANNEHINVSKTISSTDTTLDSLNGIGLSCFTINTQNLLDEGCINIDIFASPNTDNASTTIYNHSFDLLRQNVNKPVVKIGTISGKDLININASSSRKHFIYKDYAVEYGKQYNYFLQPYNSKKYKEIQITNVEDPSTHIIQNPLKIHEFEHMVLLDEDYVFVNKFNPKMSTYKSNLMVSKIETLGAQYPFIRENGNNNYKSFSIGGLISANEVFQYLRSETWHQAEPEFLDQIYHEREFKNKILAWLNNGKPKLLKTPTEGNFIVQLMNVSLTPVEQLGRKLHSFTCDAYEIMPYTQENLEEYLHYSTNYSVLK